MGITVISSPSMSTAAVSSPLPSAGSPDAPLSGFAALLSGQLGLEVTAETSGITSAEKELDPQAALTEEPTLDPGLAFLMAAPTIPLAPQTKIESTAGDSIDVMANGDRALLGQTGLSDDRLAELARRSAGSSETENGALGTAANPFEAAAAKAKGQAFETANIAAETVNTAASAATSTQQASNASANAQISSKLETPLHSSNWTQDFGEKIVWMAKNDHQSAQLNINPPQLGPVQITLQINGDQASAIFASPHPEVRQAIESSLTQLKEMLSSAGINLGQTDIGANLAQQNRDTPFQSANGNRSTDENAILPGIGNATDNGHSSPIQRGRGLVDLFA